MRVWRISSKGAAGPSYREALEADEAFQAVRAVVSRPRRIFDRGRSWPGAACVRAAAGLEF